MKNEKDDLYKDSSGNTSAESSARSARVCYAPFQHGNSWLKQKQELMVLITEIQGPAS